MSSLKNIRSKSFGKYDKPPHVVYGITARSIFVQQFVQTDNKETSVVRVTVPSLGESTGDHTKGQ